MAGDSCSDAAGSWFSSDGAVDSEAFCESTAPRAGPVPPSGERNGLDGAKPLVVDGAELFSQRQRQRRESSTLGGRIELY